LRIAVVARVVHTFLPVGARDASDAAAERGLADAGAIGAAVVRIAAVARVVHALLSRRTGEAGDAAAEAGIGRHAFALVIDVDAVHLM